VVFVCEGLRRGEKGLRDGVDEIGAEAAFGGGGASGRDGTIEASVTGI